MEELFAQYEKRKKNFPKFGALKINKNQQNQLIEFLRLLVKWNKAYNLTAIRDPKEMLVKHLFDSLAVGEFLKGQRFIDVGTGAGLPGLPLAIAYPDRQFILLDSLGKRIQFIRNVIRELKLTNVTPVLSRVENFQDEVGFDGVLSRAFASLADMTTWCAHLPCQNGFFYALKGQCNQEEIKAIKNDFCVEQIISLQVPELESERHLIILKKLVNL